MLLFYAVVLCCCLLTTTIWGEDDRQSFFVKDTSTPFGFTLDPIHNYSPPYTNLTFDDLFYYGPCVISPASEAIYGPCLHFSEKVNISGYPTPVHIWGISFDTVLRLNTTDLKNKMIWCKDKFAQLRYVHTRTKAWNIDNWVVYNTYKPEWTSDGPIEDYPAFNADLNDYVVRVEDDGSNFHLWDLPAISEKITWIPINAHKAIKYSNFSVHFYENMSDDETGWIEHASLRLLFHTKSVLCFDTDCDWWLNGDATADLGAINIPDWLYPPLNCSF